MHTSLFHRLRGAYRKYTRYAPVFSSPLDARRYDRLKRNRRAETARAGTLPPASFRLKPLGGRTVLCRPGTTDPLVLWDTFGRGVQPVPIPLQGPAVIVDLGANVGYTAAHYAHLYPEAQIVMVEMDRANLELASRNVAPFADRCRLVHAAVWRSDGEVAYGGAEEWGYRVSDLDGAPAAGTTVPARSLESLFDEYALETVDFLKMDIEGTEAAILDGPMRWADRVRSMRVELHPPATWERCSAALRERGFVCSKHEMEITYLVAVREEASSS